jgi:hypothetical protein
MATYIFYTDQGLTIAPNGEEVENFQIIGFEEGISEAEAFENLLKNNNWINEMKFSTDNFKCKLVFEANFSSKVNKVLDYLWKDEERHYEENKDNEEFLENHIFKTLQEIKSEL